MSFALSTDPWNYHWENQASGAMHCNMGQNDTDDRDECCCLEKSSYGDSSHRQSDVQESRQFCHALCSKTVDALAKHTSSLSAYQYLSMASNSAYRDIYAYTATPLPKNVAQSPANLSYSFQTPSLRG
jgi:hypothetical protein